MVVRDLPIIAYLGLGSNLGDRAALLEDTVSVLDQTPQITVTGWSSLYETQPVGLTDQPDFLNAVVEVQTTLSLRGLLDAILRQEQMQGRVRNFRWGPRVIDIDILLFGDLVSAVPDMTVPHPRLTERAFALAPLAEVAPSVVFPDGETAQKKWQRLQETGNNFGIRVVKPSGCWHTGR